VLSGVATNTNFIIFGITRPGLNPTLYRTRGEHANHDNTDAIPPHLAILISAFMLIEMPARFIVCKLLFVSDILLI
jgi:hypothetical protein